jgi:hypothetical protein
LALKRETKLRESSMKHFADLTDADFAPVTRKEQRNFAYERRADLVLHFWGNPQKTRTNFVVNMMNSITDELGLASPYCFDVAWAERPRMLRVTACATGEFPGAENVRQKGKKRRSIVLRLPLLSGLVATRQKCEPEYYVDAEAKTLLIEVPSDFGIALANLPVGTKLSKMERANAK